MYIYTRGKNGNERFIGVVAIIIIRITRNAISRFISQTYSSKIYISNNVCIFQEILRV